MPDTPFATAQDVADRWRTLTPDEEYIADVLAGDASDLIRDRWPDVDNRITSGALRANSLVRIVSGMVRRAMLAGGNEGWETRTEAAGPFSIGGKLSNPNGNLYPNADDIHVLDGYPSGRAFAVDLWDATQYRCADAAG